MIAEVIKFGITGGLGTITNLFIFFLCADVLKLPPIPVSIGCFIIAGTQNYFLNHNWSFKEYTSKTSVSFRKWIEFITGSLLGLAVNIAVMNAIVSNYRLPYKFIAQGCGILAGMVLNFIISKYFVFRGKKTNGDTETKNHE